MATRRRPWRRCRVAAGSVRGARQRGPTATARQQPTAPCHSTAASPPPAAAPPTPSRARTYGGGIEVRGEFWDGLKDGVWGRGLGPGFGDGGLGVGLGWGLVGAER